MHPHELYARLAELARSERRFVVATVVETGGSSPQKAGAKLVLLDDGTLLGTVGGGAIEKQVLEAAQALLAPNAPASRLLETQLTRDLGMCCGGRMTVYLERHEPAAQLWLFGAGHVNRAVAALAADVGFRVTVIDEREEWLTAERFPRAARELEDPAVAARRLHTGPRDLLAVATHDHALDEDVVFALGNRDAAFLGVIGSARKAIRLRERLTQRGLDATAVARMQCPMGLDIGAQSPEEIAVAVVGELIRVRAAAQVRATGPRAVKSES